MRATAICLTLLLVGCHRLIPPTEPDRRRIILFLDVTTSLAGDESAAVQKTVNDIVDKAPADTELLVIPICANTENAPYGRYLLPYPEGSSEIARRKAEAERAKIKTDIASSVQKIQQQTAAVRTQYASCISPALRVAQNEVHNSSRKWNNDVIFVSDMIEECQMSLLGQPVRLLAGPQFAEANKLLVGQQALLSVPDVRVFVILPKAVSSIVRKDYPEPHELKKFWQHLFARSGIPSNRLWWDADVSQYIESIQG